MTITKGLAGIVALESSISSIIDNQLTYVGYSIDDLAKESTFEEVIFLLWHRRLPNALELTDLKSQLAQHASLPHEVLEHLKRISTNHTHPMAVLRAAISLVSLFDSQTEDMNSVTNYQKAISIQAKTASIIAAIARIRQGHEPVEPNRDFAFAENFLYMLTGKKPTALAKKAFDQAMILHADHELNASTFTARVCVATLSDIYSGIISAISALKGPLHGGANEAVMKMLEEIGTKENVEDYIINKLHNKEKIMGFGHRVYQNGDPRAKHLKALSKEVSQAAGDVHWYELSVRVEEIVAIHKNILPNVDFYSASLYHALGIDHDLFTPVFAISRTSGWLAHIMEQYEDNRLIRPRAAYKGPERQIYVTLADR